MKENKTELHAIAPELLRMLERIVAAESRMPGNNAIAGLCDEARKLIAIATMGSR